MKTKSKLLIFCIVSLYTVSFLKAQDTISYHPWRINAGIIIPFDYKKTYIIPEYENYPSYRYQNLMSYSFGFAYQFKLKKSRRFTVNTGLEVVDLRHTIHIDTMIVVSAYYPQILKLKQGFYQSFYLSPFVNLYYSLGKHIKIYGGSGKLFGFLQYANYNFWNGDNFKFWGPPISGFFYFNTGFSYNFSERFDIAFEIQSHKHFTMSGSFNMKFKLSYNFD